MSASWEGSGPLAAREWLDAHRSGIARTGPGMVGSALPQWVVPSSWQVADLGWLAYRDWVDGGEPWVGGVLAAVGWVSGEVLGPVTDREEQPVTRQLAEAEAATAAVVGTDQWHAAVLACLGLSVPYREPRVGDRWFGVCVWKTLQWLLGDPESPLALPVRNEDGSLPMVAETFEAYVNVECVVAEDPTHQRRQALREQAEHDVRTWRGLVERIEETQRRLAAG